MQEKLPLRFGKNELAGAFGDVGTDVPLLLLLIVTCRLDARSVLILFGACQIFAGLAYRLPVPVQPLKAMAVIAIARSMSGSEIAAGGLIIGAIMLVLSLSGGLAFLGRHMPTSVVRGIQFGLGVKLARLALERIAGQGVEGYGLTEGYVLAGVALVICVVLRGSRRYPASLFVLAIGFMYALLAKGGWQELPSLSLGLPSPVVGDLKAADFLTGLLVLAIPQLPLSIGNAVLATKQTVHDLYGQDVSVRKLGLTYSLCNLLSPLVGGFPVCHGSGGVAGHHAFGARTGGSVIMYGAMFLTCGLLFGKSIVPWMMLFPMALLGVLLLFEAIALMRLSREMVGGTEDEFFQVLTVGLVAGLLPEYGFVVAIVLGIGLHAWLHWRRTVAAASEAKRDPDD